MDRSLFHKVFPAFAVACYWLVLVELHGFRNDHLAIGILLLVLAYGGYTARGLLKFILPFLLTAIVYDSQRFYSDSIRGTIHIREPYLFDKFFFGISTGSAVLTPNEWLQLHIHPVLDLVTGFAYLVFFSIFILVAGYFYYYVGKTGTARRAKHEVVEMARRMPWAFFWLNVLGYSTYYWYAAAPPWYVSLYGLGPTRIDVPASSAGCIRFDQILGTHFFSEMYGRAADVFGAIPSLHVAYPLLTAIFAFQIGTGRVFCIVFYLLMCFSAVYLNHHYLLDIIWGSGYALLISWCINWYYDRKKVARAT